MEEDSATSWGSRSFYTMSIISQTMGVNAFISLPHMTVANGAVGYLICYCLAYILLGIPLVYMENVIGQFTARDCLYVWKARPCFSHFGYIHVLWQCVFVIYCHTINSFTLHYFLISFESPIPYYECGEWSKSNCDTLLYNYTVNKDCIKHKEPFDYCANLFTTFPECQYWRYNILGLDQTHFHVAWRVGLASGIICVLTYLSCLRRGQSMRWVIGFVTIYPIASYILLMMGSMMQKGIVVKFGEAMDSNFDLYTKNFDFSSLLAEVVYTLNIGTGISFNLSSRASFRNLNYSSTVVAIVISCGVITLSVCTTALMCCPTAFEYGLSTGYLFKFSMGKICEITPRLLHEYDSKTFWLILFFSSISTTITGMNTIYITSLLELLASRYSTVALYPSLVTLVGLIFLYFATIPLVGNVSLAILVRIKRTFNVIILFVAMFESAVFILWYGLGRLSEDVHFMQGTQPPPSVKAGWMASSALLVYVFFSELYKLYSSSDKSIGTLIGWWFLIITVAWAILVLLTKIIVSLCKNKFTELVRLDPTWGPKSEVLKRSRTMFTVQAMTKEYLYRQYHLQAGILVRQRRSNVRNIPGATV